MEVFYRKNKNGWECYDSNGISATGATKEIAHNRYKSLIAINNCNVNTSYNMNNIEKVGLNYGK